MQIQADSLVSHLSTWLFSVFNWMVLWPQYHVLFYGGEEGPVEEELRGGSKGRDPNRAKVDGALQSMEGDIIKAIMEGERARRGRDFGATMRETCQLAGFLRTTKDSHLPLNGQ